MARTAGEMKAVVTATELGGVGRSLEALIDVRLLRATDPEQFERRVARLDSVREMAFLTGRFDYQLRVACRDADDLNETVRAIRREAGAAGTETRIVLRSSSLERDAGNLMLHKTVLRRPAGPAPDKRGSHVGAWSIR